MLLLLDSTVLIDVLRGRPAVDRLRVHRDAGDAVATTPINIEEVVRGLRSDEAETTARLFGWLHTIPFGYAEAWQAGTWRREYSARGTTLSQSDCLIAALAYTSDARLVTGNPRHFPMTEIAVEHWPPGE